MNYKKWMKLWKPMQKNLYKEEMKHYLKWNTPIEAESSSDKLLELFHNYLDEEDFVGADEAKRHLHMGFTRVKPYTLNMGVVEGDSEVEQDWDAVDKARGGRIFYHRWKEAQQNPKYLKLRRDSLSKK